MQIIEEKEESNSMVHETLTTNPRGAEVEVETEDESSEQEKDKNEKLNYNNCSCAVSGVW